MKTRKTKRRAPRAGDSISAKWMEVARSRGMTEQPPAAKKAGAALWSLLEDPLPSVRNAAGFALASIRDPSLVQAFILALEGANASRAARVAVTLGTAGFTNAAPYFLSTFSKQHASAAASFATALGLLAEKSAVPALIAALEDDFVPLESAVALGQLNDPAAIPALVKALGHKKDTVRAAAAYSLACIGGASEADEAKVLKALKARQKDSSRRVRLCAAVARFERGDAEAMDSIRAALN